jgi:hypothetical protein
LFASLLAFNDVGTPANLWDAFKLHMCDDFLRTAQQANPASVFGDDVEGSGLAEVGELLAGMGGRSLSEFSLLTWLPRLPLLACACRALLYNRSVAGLTANNRLPWGF